MNKRSILFVDDEQMVLQGLKRMLFKYKKEWDMHFVSSGVEAIEFLKTNHVDIVVSDMKMPGMDGIQLLEGVKRQYPDIIRIILSGQSDEDQLKKAAVVAHQFLSKPCSSETIKEVIDNALFTFGILNNESVKRILSNIDSLPTLPTVYQELMQETNSEDFSLKRVGEIVARDASLSANILKLINSPFWGLSRKIMTPEQATSLLGFDVIKGLVLSTDIFHQLNVEENPLFSPSKFLAYCQKASALSKKIMKDIGGSKEECDLASIAGMLNDLGRLILFANFNASYSTVITMSSEQKRPLQIVEREMIGVTHADIAAYLLGIWGLEKQVVEAIAYHHTPILAPTRTPTVLTAVAAANAILDEAEGDSPADVLSYLEECGIQESYEKWKSL